MAAPNGVRLGKGKGYGEARELVAERASQIAPVP